MSTTAAGTGTTTTFTTTSTSLTGLKPPSCLQKLTTEGWTKWKQLFEIYRIASGTNKMADDVQVAVFLHCIGEECVDVYNTLGLTDDEKNSYDTVLQKFEEHFVPIKNESVSSHMFFTRNQEPGESFDAYLTELKKLSADCNFSTLRERLIRDRIVAGILDKRVKDRLLRESELTLVKTVKICKSAELSEQHVKKLEPTKEVASIKEQLSSGNSKTHDGDAGNNMSRVQQTKMTSSSSSTTREPGASRQQVTACQRCGYNHRFKNCPAFMKDCINCGPSGGEMYDGFQNTYSITAGYMPPYNITKVLNSPAWRSIQKFSNVRNIQNLIPKLRNHSTVICKNLTAISRCQDSPCLFDLDKDPCEENDLSDLYSVFVEFMKARLDTYRKTLVPLVPLVLDPAANTEKFNYTWSIWAD